MGIDHISTYKLFIKYFLLGKNYKFGHGVRVVHDKYNEQVVGTRGT